MKLPETLADLIPLLDEWATPDLALRAEKLNTAGPPELSSLTDLVFPRLDAIDAYLDSFGSRPLDANARRLLLLAECALEAQHELEAR